MVREVRFRSVMPASRIDRNFYRAAVWTEGTTHNWPRRGMRHSARWSADIQPARFCFEYNCRRDDRRSEFVKRDLYQWGTHHRSQGIGIEDVVQIGPFLLKSSPAKGRRRLRHAGEDAHRCLPGDEGCTKPFGRRKGQAARRSLFEYSTERVCRDAWARRAPASRR